MKYYAHSLEGVAVEKWQTLDEHLQNVSKRAADFASYFGAGEWGKIEGLNHDIGKGSNDWQAYLRKENEIVDEFADYYKGHPTHAAVGAQWLYENSKQAGKLLSYCIAGHHGGLPNWSGSSAGLSKKVQLPLPEVSIPIIIPDFPANLPFDVDPNRMGYQFQFYKDAFLLSC